MTKKFPTSIGIEIEVNNFTQPLRTSMDRGLWQTGHEHCGTELRSIPCSGVGKLRQLRKSIEEMHQKAGVQPGFFNAGTHLHIDFLREELEEGPILKRKACEQKTNSLGQKYWNNPTGSYNKWYWIDQNGARWHSPAVAREGWRRGLAKSRRANSPSRVYTSQQAAHAPILMAVKRFFCIGIRFADVLFAIQHPDRRFNKYCHTIEDWNEDQLFACTSIFMIASHPGLQQSHKRHMFNAISFKKWGTIEIRMIKATLNPDHIWPQVVLFSKLANVAKDPKQPIPEPSGIITQDLIKLLNFAGVTGKNRQLLVRMMKESLETKTFRCICYRCHNQFDNGQIVDFGLSRGLCPACNSYAQCVCCGRAVDRKGAFRRQKVDDMVEGGRWLCRNCHRDNLYRAHREKEITQNKVKALNKWVGSGFDEQGMRQLRRMREIFG